MENLRISTKTSISKLSVDINLEKFKENFTLQAALLDLKANFEGSAVGVVLESRIDTGKGPVSTI